jgi:hypothetical protein
MRRAISPFMVRPVDSAEELAAWLAIPGSTP